MDEAKDNVDYSSATQQHYHSQKEAKKGSQQQGRFATTEQQPKKNRQKKSSETAFEPPNPPQQSNHQDQKTAQQQQMEVIKQQQQNDGGNYPTIRSEENRQNNGPNVTAGDARKDQQPESQQQGGNKKREGKDRQQEATDLAHRAAEKHAKYYDGTLNSLCGTFPVKKSVSTFNRLKGSTESPEQTLNSLIQGLHTIDFGISFLIWRTFFFAKDLSANIYTKAGAKGNDIYGTVSALPLPMTIALAAGLIIFSPIIVGSLFFIIPALLFMLAVILIPAMFILPPAIVCLIIFDMMPFPNKKAGSLTKNSFGRIPIFNRGQKTEGKEAEEIRSTMGYQQKTH